MTLLAINFKLSIKNFFIIEGYMNLELINNKIVLKKRPNPSVTEELFELKTEELKELQDGEILVNVKYVSIDPAMRGWISAVSYTHLTLPTILLV